MARWWTIAALVEATSVVEVKVAVATVVAVAMAMAAVVMAEVAKWASAQMVKGLKAGTQAAFLAAHEEEARMEVTRGALLA